jgi:uncharacterized membrane protein
MTKLRALDEWFAGHLAGDPALRKRPGPILLAIVSAAVVVWICLQRNLWPSPFGKFAGLDPLLVTLAMILVFVATAKRRWHRRRSSCCLVSIRRTNLPGPGWYGLADAGYVVGQLTP